jgi:hypothetical protein
MADPKSAADAGSTPAEGASGFRQFGRSKNEMRPEALLRAAFFIGRLLH